MRFASVAVLALLTCAMCARGAEKKIEPHWVATWATAQVGPEPSQPQLTDEQLTDTTVRQIVHFSMGGSMLRVQISNAFGTKPLKFDSVHVAKAKSPTSSAIDVSTDHAVTFNGESSVLVPIGAVYVSDPIEMKMEPLSDLAISFHYAEPPSVQTSHPGSRANSYFVHGMHSGDSELAGAEKTERWLGLAEVDVTAKDAARTIVALGDSITNGHASTLDGNGRWTDVLAQRLQADKKLQDVAVANEGIGGNHLLTNGLGQNALQRFDRDVLAVSGVK